MAGVILAIYVMTFEVLGEGGKLSMSGGKLGGGGKLMMMMMIPLHSSKLRMVNTSYTLEHDCAVIEAGYTHFD